MIYDRKCLTFEKICSQDDSQETDKIKVHSELFNSNDTLLPISDDEPIKILSKPTDMEIDIEPNIIQINKENEKGKPPFFILANDNQACVETT